MPAITGDGRWVRRIVAAASTTNAASAARTAIQAARETLSGTGSTSSGTARLIKTTRTIQKRSIRAELAFNAAGPPPRTTGSRNVSAPSSVCPTKPTSTSGSSPDRLCRDASVISVTANQAVPAASIQDAAVCGRRCRSVRTNGTSASTAAPAYTSRPPTTTHRSEASRPPTATASPGTAKRRDQRAIRPVPSTIRVRRTVGHSVNSVPSTARPTQPRMLTCACAACIRSCHSDGIRPDAISPPRVPPVISAAPAHRYQATTCAKRPPRALRPRRASTVTCAATTPTTAAAPPAARAANPSETPHSTAAIPAFSTASRVTGHQSGGAWTRSSADAKCSVHVTIALVTAPSRNRWISSHCGMGRSCRKAAAATVSASQTSTTPFATACHRDRERRGAGGGPPAFGRTPSDVMSVPFRPGRVGRVLPPGAMAPV
ncbi:Uncharacterised protein [Mycobacterium tuberculosis]|nr:Uncharacterised protein [Mycobacterium tuberculosis]